MATATNKQNKPADRTRENVTQSKSSTDVADVAADYSELQEDFQTFVDDVSSSVTTYCRKRPGVAACMLFGLGFYVGWKMKPW